MHPPAPGLGPEREHAAQRRAVQGRKHRTRTGSTIAACRHALPHRGATSQRTQDPRKKAHDRHHRPRPRFRADRQTQHQGWPSLGQGLDHREGLLPSDAAIAEQGNTGSVSTGDSGKEFGPGRALVDQVGQGPRPGIRGSVGIEIDDKRWSSRGGCQPYRGHDRQDMIGLGAQSDDGRSARSHFDNVWIPERPSNPLPNRLCYVISEGFRTLRSGELAPPRG